MTAPAYEEGTGLGGAWLHALHAAGWTRLLPPSFLRPGLGGLAGWQWMGLALALVFSLALGSLLGRLTRRTLEGAARRAPEHWLSGILSRLEGPVTGVWSLALLVLALPWLELHGPAALALHRAVRTGFLALLFWFLLRTVDEAGGVLAERAWTREHAASRSLISLGRRAAKTVLWALGLVAILANLGFSVGSLLAGLGIGGVALALAAQKTVENLFGAFSIAVDQPFHEGDFVKVGDVVGTVETIGLRSTKIRTLDRTVVNIPNGKLADLPLESFAVRDRMRLSTTLGLTYETTPAQMRRVLSDLEGVLRGHPKIWPDSLMVKFSGFGGSSLDVDVMAWFRTSDWNEFLAIRQEVLLQFMEAVEKAGSSFAFPSRTVYLTDNR